MAERAPQSSHTDNDAACSNHEGNETNRSVRPGTLYLSPGISTERHFLVTNCCLLLLSPAAETLESYLQLLVPRRHHGGAEEEGEGGGGAARRVGRRFGRRPSSVAPAVRFAQVSVSMPMSREYRTYNRQF